MPLSLLFSPCFMLPDAGISIAADVYITPHYAIASADIRPADDAADTDAIAADGLMLPALILYLLMPYATLLRHRYCRHADTQPHITH